MSNIKKTIIILGVILTLNFLQLRTIGVQERQKILKTHLTQKKEYNLMHNTHDYIMFGAIVDHCYESLEYDSPELHSIYRNIRELTQENKKFLAEKNYMQFFTHLILTSKIPVDKEAQAISDNMMKYSEENIPFSEFIYDAHVVRSQFREELRLEEIKAETSRREKLKIYLNDKKYPSTFNAFDEIYESLKTEAPILFELYDQMKNISYSNTVFIANGAVAKFMNNTSNSTLSNDDKKNILEEEISASLYRAKENIPFSEFMHDYAHVRLKKR